MDRPFLRECEGVEIARIHRRRAELTTISVDAVRHGDVSVVPSHRRPRFYREHFGTEVFRRGLSLWQNSRAWQNSYLCS